MNNVVLFTDEPQLEHLLSLKNCFNLFCDEVILIMCTPFTCVVSEEAL